MRYLIPSVLILLCGTAVQAHPVGVVVGLRPEHFDPIVSLYHSQNNAGNYVYGYATPTSTKSETKDAHGVTHGGYSYIDGDGHLQTVHYTADAIHGFRVAATNLPQDLPDVAHAKLEHQRAYEAVKSDLAQAALKVAYSNPIAVAHGDVPQLQPHQLLPEPVKDLPEVVKARAEHLAALQAAYAGHASLAVLPQPVQDLPEVVKARAEHLATLEATRARDAALRSEISLSPIPDQLTGHVVPVHTGESNQPLPVAPVPQAAYAPESYGYEPYSYGYMSPFGVKSESQSPDGVVRGGYSYLDAHGVVQTVNYIADKDGFRVAASNLPVDENHLAIQKAVGVTPQAQAEEKILAPTLYNAEIKY
ncbi:uncharacterized protein LOC132703945 isoform X2 [Cylas formicarius]|uniref:uncharacterized protein LOC132703945 isoform X2 n=1 Tax=Cylas formicarius TaxID=197179 RepID=UPI0029588CBB|nr:uncharacterized protein LOC132703945 isoform X2 [Cylas formicarius]